MNKRTKAKNNLFLYRYPAMTKIIEDVIFCHLEVEIHSAGRWFATRGSLSLHVDDLGRKATAVFWSRLTN